MNRDVRLHVLSSEHHQTLVLARRLSALATAASDVVREVESAWRRQLEPHFQIEEELLVPALRAAGLETAARQLTDEHQALRRRVTRIVGGDHDGVGAFAKALVAHVRFEERELFPRCEQSLPDAVLDEVDRRTRRRD